MNSNEINQLASILVPVSMFALVFGIVYLSKRERMAMIERGMDPRHNKPETSSYNPNIVLTIGLLLIGAGAGLFLAYLLDNTVFNHFGGDATAIYFSLISIFGGAGLFLSYQMERKAMEKRNEL